jgi:hypothetical protein
MKVKARNSRGGMGEVDCFWASRPTTNEQFLLIWPKIDHLIRFCLFIIDQKDNKYKVFSMFN